MWGFYAIYQFSKTLIQLIHLAYSKRQFTSLAQCKHRETQSFTFTPKANLESPIKLTSIALWEKVRLPSRHREIMETPQRKGLAQESSNLLTRSLSCCVKCFSTFTKSVLSGGDAVRPPMAEITILYVCGEDNYILSNSVAAWSYNYIPIFKIRIKTIR